MTGKVYKLSADIFNIAVWSNRAEGKKKVGCGKRFIFTLIAAIVILAQVQISFTIISTFIEDITSSTDKSKLAPWNAELFVSTIACFFITAVQIFAEAKDRVVVMTTSSNPIFWLLSFVSWFASCLVSVAVFLTVYQQETVNDLWFNYAGLLVIIQIDDLMGAWACSYMLDEELQESDEFLCFKATELELAVAEKMVLALMGLYVIWTISLYRVYKQVGESYITKTVDKYEGIADKYEKEVKNHFHKGLQKVADKVTTTATSGAAPQGLNLASLDEDRSRGALYDILEDYESNSSLSALALMNQEDAAIQAIVSLAGETTEDKMKVKSTKKKVTRTEFIQGLVIYIMPIVILFMFFWPVGLLLLRCCHGLCCCCRKKEIEEEDEYVQMAHAVYEEQYKTMKERAEAQKTTIASLEEQVHALMERATAITEKASVAIN